MINRAALLLKYKAPAIQWVLEADPFDSNPGLTEDDINEDRTVYLISDEDADTPEDLEEWLRLNYSALFETELAGWYNDKSIWPEPRDWEQFNEWFKPECHTVIEDTLGTPIVDDDSL